MPAQLLTLLHGTSADLATNASNSPSTGKRLKFAAFLFASGAVFGTLLDGIHGTVHLLNYDAAPLEVGGLHSSWFVLPLLGSFYAVVGPLLVYLDGRAAEIAAGLSAFASSASL